MTTPLIPTMNRKNMIRLFALAAIWGGSFIFTRLAAPQLGPVITADARALVAGGFLLAYLLFRKIGPNWRQNMRHYIIMGFLNAAFPFVCFSYAGMHIPAGYSALLNATVPLFSAILSIFFFADKLTTSKIIGIACGAAGVALVAKVGGIELTTPVLISLFSCLAATLCYALAGIYIKKHAHKTSLTAMTMGSQMLGGLMLLPVTPFAPMPGHPDLLTLGCVLTLGIVCTGIALIIYYQMIQDIGLTKASTVTFLVPLFGVLWGMIFLHEAVTFPMLAGMGLILAGTRWVLKR